MAKARARQFPAAKGHNLGQWKPHDTLVYTVHKHKKKHILRKQKEYLEIQTLNIKYIKEFWG